MYQNSGKDIFMCPLNVCGFYRMKDYCTCAVGWTTNPNPGKEKAHEAAQNTLH